MLFRLAILLLTICSYSHSSPYSWTQISGTEQTPVQYIEDNPEVEIIWGYENGLWFQYSVVEMNESIENSHPTLEFLSPDKNYWIRTLGDTPAATQNKPDSVIIPKLNWNPENYFKGEWEVRKIHYEGWNLGANRILIESLKAIQSTSPGELNEKFSEKVLIQEIAPISNKVLQLEQQTYSHEKYLRAYEDNNTSRVETAYFREKATFLL